MPNAADEFDKMAERGESLGASSSYGDLGVMCGPYFAHGEYGVLFERKGFNQVVKIMNLDVIDDGEIDESNYNIMEFLNDWRHEGIRNLPKIYYWLRQEVYKETIHTVKYLCAANGQSALYEEVLNFEIGDEIFAYSMEVLDAFNWKHYDTINSARKAIAEAVIAIYEETGELITDFKPSNVGLRGDTIVIFDFKLASPQQEARFVFAEDKVSEILNDWYFFSNP